MADRIDEGCLALGLSQADLARRAGLPSTNYISRMKAGEISGRKHLAAIARALQCEVIWLTTGNGTPPPWAIERNAHGQARPPQAEKPLTSADALAPRSVMGQLEMMKIIVEQGQEVNRLYALVRILQDEVRELEAWQIEANKQLAELEARRDDTPGPRPHG